MVEAIHDYGGRHTQEVVDGVYNVSPPPPLLSEFRLIYVYFNPLIGVQFLLFLFISQEGASGIFVQDL